MTYRAWNLGSQNVFRPFLIDMVVTFSEAKEDTPYFNSGAFYR